VASHPDEPASAQALNGVLAPDVRILSSDVAAEGFDARRDARSRSYRYRVEVAPVASPFERGRALHSRAPLDRAVLDACAASLLGRHDFTAFTKAQSEHSHFERTIARSEWAEEENGGVLAFWIEADSFLRHMVRALVGTMLFAAGPNEGDATWFESLLEGRPRSEAADTAAAHGLYLESVSY